MESKAQQLHSTAGRYFAQSKALKLRYVPAVPGPVGAVDTNDWCIKLKIP